MSHEEKHLRNGICTRQAASSDPLIGLHTDPAANAPSHILKTHSIQPPALILAPTTKIHITATSQQTQHSLISLLPSFTQYPKWYGEHIS